MKVTNIITTVTLGANPDDKKPAADGKSKNKDIHFMDHSQQLTTKSLFWEYSSSGPKKPRIDRMPLIGEITKGDDLAAIIVASWRIHQVFTELVTTKNQADF
ncbi:hypothetical protein G6F46_007026 [Rhizopus delemar]|uniref:Uncharacterized protein n=2 Tax=Rhizopus TaxID=4842 RepID=A0A9P6Z4U3_9FUNG|nr:hypothetical protein G6F55_006366 [Rhizopus delemar]KAG1542628.1 hypothetical protein G6F51_007160 [Rhizopus arrhizus]KAG1501879.1 hypothetical protein G6F54_002739 [Rhizopus delemar]KAG1510336.1 hypothetical protein G6F53_006759 [Rhizopus delemar]KAG1525261.1 hypothetical protein G6F52_003485 [Rhizopus delemar]